MQPTLKHMLRLAFVAWLTIAFVMSTYAQDKPAVREGKNPPIEVTRINPSRGDLRKIREKRKQEVVAREEQVHVIKLYVKMPPPGGRAYVLYVGDQKIEEYGGFAEGIFFKAYERKDLDSWKGQSVRFVAGNEVIDLGVSFPAKTDEETPARLPDLSEVLKRK